MNQEKYWRSIRPVAEEISAAGGRVLITGASGLIGSCITDTLTEANRAFGKAFEVYAMARDGERLKARFREDVHCIAQDVTEPIRLDGMDYIIHAASNADPGSYALYPAETLLTGIIGAKNVLDSCKGKKTRALLTSSFEVYGRLDREEYAEEDYGVIDLDRIRSCYPESKRGAEMLFRAYHDEYQTDCVIVRLSSVYGPTMRAGDSKAHAQFLRNAMEGKDIVLKSRGTQRRSYCYVMDAVSGILTVLFKGKAGEAYNLGHSAASIAEVAQTVAEITGRRVVYGLPEETERKGFSEPRDCILNTEKIRALGWKGKYDLRQGLRETLEIAGGKTYGEHKAWE